MMDRTMRVRAMGAVGACLAMVAGCGEPTGTETGGTGEMELEAEVVVSGLTNPLHLTAPPGDDRLFVVEKPGRVRIVEGGQLRPTPFLDLGDQVSSGGEQGLLGLAFHPDYAANGLFYVSYTDLEGDTRVERYAVSADPNVADPQSGVEILALTQPFSNHNGGLVTFGPDGMLYVGLGDGGSGGDPLENAQDSTNLLGALLRLDVDGGEPYATPPDNPFVGRTGADEIWAYGLRNPWRFAFDPVAGLLYVADVGQSSWEEVNVQPADAPGLNYGWDVMEGRHCFEPPDGCDQGGLTQPALEYASTQPACSVTGGFVYRGDAIPGIGGHYFYSDFCAGFLRSFRFEDGEVTDEREWDVGALGNVLSFGEDAAGELYVLSGNGTVYRLVEGGS